MWLVFPLIWLLSDRSGSELLGENIIKVLHCFFDIVTKTVFGIAIARFRNHYSHEMWAILEKMELDPWDAEAELLRFGEGTV
ncbi:hypothetical protein T484DRAFT_1866369, partial [Baffinella frigidus]